MTDRTQSSSRRVWWASRDNRYLVLIVCVLVLLGSFGFGHLYGRYLASLEIGGRDNALEQLRAESQKLKTHGDQLSAKITDLQTKLTKTQAALDAIMPSANTYNISPNQALIVGDGHLTVGLIGAPGNEGVTLSVNGKQQTVSAGQVINVAVDSSRNCQLAVQSFDMFKAVITATCPDTKAK